MGRKGVETPEAVRDHIITLGKDQPGLSNREIRLRVESDFNSSLTVDQSTVGRILERAGIPSAKRDRLAQVKNPTPTSDDSETHWRRHSRDLIEPVSALRVPGSAALGDYDLAVWHSRMETDPEWPVPGGMAQLGGDGDVRFSPSVANLASWNLLRQHLPGNSFWSALDAWSVSYGQELHARLELLNTIISRIESAKSQGGLGAKVLNNIDPDGVRGSAVGLYYAFTIYHQVLSRVLEVPLGAKSKEEFHIESKITIRLGDHIVISDRSKKSRDAGVQYLLDAQESWVDMPEAITAGSSHRSAKAAGDTLGGHAQRLALFPTLPTETRCDVCDTMLGR